MRCVCEGCRIGFRMWRRRSDVASVSLRFRRLIREESEARRCKARRGDNQQVKCNLWQSLACGMRHVAWQQLTVTAVSCDSHTFVGPANFPWLYSRDILTNPKSISQIHSYSLVWAMCAWSRSRTKESKVFALPWTR